MNIRLLPLPNDDFTYMGISADIVENIEIDNITVGIVYLSERTDNSKKYMYIEWIEFLSVFRGKNLLKPVLTTIYEKHGVLRFESDEDLKTKYISVGATLTGYDDRREMYSFEYLPGE